MLDELIDDRAGNLTRQTDNAANRAKHMSYDHANRVTRVTNPATGETVGRYHYDDQGFRVRKTALDDDGVDRKETMLLYASMYFGVEIQKDVYTGEEIYNVLNNIYLNGVRVAAMVPTGEAAHFHTDQVDSVKVVTNDAGAVVSRMEYLPYGETWFREGDDRFAPKYNSQELDRESGYYFYNARHYDPEICRFVTADTVIDGEFDTQGWNRFMYVKGNPIRYKDPTGHETQGVGLFGTYSKIIQASIDVQIVQDDKSNIGIAITAGVGVGSIGASVEVGVEKSNKSKIYDLAGSSRSTSKSGSIGIASGTIENTVSGLSKHDKNPQTRTSVGFSVKSPVVTAGTSVNMTNVYGVNIEKSKTAIETLMDNTKRIIRGEISVKNILNGVKNPMGASFGEKSYGEAATLKTETPID